MIDPRARSCGLPLWRRLLILAFLFISIAPATDAQEGMYANSFSFVKGDTVRLYISTSAQPDTIFLYHEIDKRHLSRTFITTHWVLQPARDSAYLNGCGWSQTYAFAITSLFPPGLYHAEINGSSGKLWTMFFIRDTSSTRHARIAIDFPTNTWQAYNTFGGKSLYTFNSTNGVASQKVSFSRPYDVPMGTGQYRYWGDGLIPFLESEGDPYDFYTDQEIDSVGALLDAYDVLFIYPHDEYWTLGKRRAIERFVARGGRLIILGGNTCWWQARYERNDSLLVCYKSGTLDPLAGIQDSLVTTNWYSRPLYDPENRITGVSYLEGGYVNQGTCLPRSLGYGCYGAFNTNHWAYAGTNLTDGNRFGYASRIVGYEVDGALFQWVNGIPTVTGTDQTPANYTILGLSPSIKQDGVSKGHGTMGIYRSPGGGWVFNAATINWVYGLMIDTIVTKITHNVLRHFLANTFPPDIISWSPYSVVGDTVNHEWVYLNQRAVTLSYTDSMSFSISARDPSGLPLHYFWKFRDSVIGFDSTLLFLPRIPRYPVNTLTAYAYNGQDTASISWQVTTILPGLKPKYIVLRPGYNNISVNGIPGDPSISTIFKDLIDKGKVESIFTYQTDPEGNPSYQYFIPELGGLNSLKTIDMVHGYFVLLRNGKTADSLSILIQPPPSIPPIPLNRGYNTVPYLSDSIGTAAQTFSSIAPCNLISIIRFDNTPGKDNFLRYRPGSSTELCPDQCYLLQMSAPDTLRYGGGAGKSLRVAGTSGDEPDTLALDSLVGFQPAMFAFGTNVTHNYSLVPAGTSIRFLTQSGVECGSGSFIADGVFSVLIHGGNKTDPDSGRVDSDDGILVYINDARIADTVRWLGLGHVVDLSGELLVTGIRPVKQKPSSYVLEQNYPNPFNPSTTVRYYLPEPSRVSLEIYNVLGQGIRTLASAENEEAGYKSLVWDGNDTNGNPVSSGMYIILLFGNSSVTQSHFVFSEKMLLMR